MSTIRKTPSGRSASAMPARTRAGWAWSWIASKAVIRSNCSRASSVATSRASNRALVSPRRCASSRPLWVPSSEKS